MNYTNEQRAIQTEQAENGEPITMIFRQKGEEFSIPKPRSARKPLDALIKRLKLECESQRIEEIEKLLYAELKFSWSAFKSVNLERLKELDERAKHCRFEIRRLKAQEKIEEDRLLDSAEKLKSPSEKHYFNNPKYTSVV